MRKKMINYINGLMNEIFILVIVFLSHLGIIMFQLVIMLRCLTQIINLQHFSYFNCKIFFFD